MARAKTMPVEIPVATFRSTTGDFEDAAALHTII